MVRGCTWSNPPPVLPDHEDMVLQMSKLKDIRIQINCKNCVGAILTDSVNGPTHLRACPAPNAGYPTRGHGSCL